MDKRFDTLVFPGGRTRAFTLSYDDGVVQDRRLAELFRRYGLKCTFNLNSGLLGRRETRHAPGKRAVDGSKIAPEEAGKVYRTHEIAGHGLYHSSLESVGTPLAMYEIIEDKRRLERLAGQPVKMFAYPYGRYSRKVVELLALAGYRGARTVCSTHSFSLPEDFLTWNPTCHHGDEKLMELARQFVAEGDNAPRLFYVWGHAYELDEDDNWQVMERLGEFLSQHAQGIWFAANGEILDYVTACRRLEYAADGSMIHNPSALDVTIRAKESFVLLPAGKTTRLEEAVRL